MLLKNNNKLLERRKSTTMGVEKKLSSVIEEKGISVLSISRRTGIDSQSLYRCMRGEQKLKASEFLAVCKVVEVDPKDFLPE